jgi:hypothetical protein
MLQPKPTRPRPTMAPLTVRQGVALAVGTGVLLVAAHGMDALQVQDSGVRGSFWQVFTGQRQHGPASPWDFQDATGYGSNTCYQVAKGTGSASDLCDINPGPGFVPAPTPALVHLLPDATCPTHVPYWATCAPTTGGGAR